MWTYSIKCLFISMEYEIKVSRGMWFLYPSTMVTKSQSVHLSDSYQSCPFFFFTISFSPSFFSCTHKKQQQQKKTVGRD